MRTRCLALFSSIALTLLHCGSSGSSGTSPPPPACGSAGVTCQKTQAVASVVALPQKSSDFAADVDGDGHVDNQLGALFDSLKSLGGVDQSGEDKAVAAGSVILLVDESSTDSAFATDQGAATVHVTSGNAHPSPDFSGAGTFTAGAAPPASFQGPIANGIFASPAAPDGPGAFAVTFNLQFAGAVAAMPFYVTRVTVTNVSGKPSKASMAGAYKSSDMSGIFIPALARSVTASIAAAPSSQSSMQAKSLLDGGNCTDADGTKATAGDGIIAACELRQNALVQTFLAPDVQLFDAAGNFKPTPGGSTKDSLSGAFELTLAPAKF